MLKLGIPTSATFLFRDDESCSYWANWYGIPVAGWNAGDNQRHNYLNMEG